MGKELVVSSDRHETKVAILEEGQLVEVYFQRANEYSLAGSIHKGRVMRVLPGMQSAFVDLGLERDTFLYVSDFLEENEDFDRVGEDNRGRQHNRPSREDVVRPIESAPVDAAPEDAELRPAIPPEAPIAAGTAPATPREERRRDDRQDDRHGRRGRRRRRGAPGGGRFPDSKFAAAPIGGPPVFSHEPLMGDAEADDSEPIILPGESLRKYRGGPPPVFPVPAPPVLLGGETDLDIEPEREETPRFLAPVPEPDAPIHHPVLSEGELPVEAEVEIEATEIDSTEPEEIEISEPERDEDLFTRGNVLGIVEPGEETEAEETASVDGESENLQQSTEAGEDVAQPALEPMSHTAHLREPAVRFLEQRSPGRRNRRRGRGGDRDRRPENRPGPERTEDKPAQDRPERSAERSPERVAERGPERSEDRGRRPERSDRPERGDRTPQVSISDLLKEGQEILVQIAKEPLGQKGARITSHIALPGRYCVYMPTVEHAGVSRKIASDEERQRLKKILLTHRQGMPGGFIIRTAGEGKTEADIAADIQYLYNLWLDIRQKAEKKKAPSVIYHDLEIVERILRDQLSEDFKAIWCDSEEIYESVLRFVQRVAPPLVPRVKMFTRNLPIFDAYGVSTELEKALRPKVWLRSGGYIVINQTEALVAVDINTGKFVGKTGRLEDTIVKTNIEAVKEIVRQIRLRDLGGIIVIDFIDMDERKNRQKVMQALEEAMRADRAPYKILQFNDFGLVAITRKRVKQSLERTLCQPCPYCEGAGYVRSVSTVITEILAEARKIAAAVEGRECLLRVNPEVAKVLKSTSNTYVEELEEILKRPVAVIADPVIHHEKFDLS